MFTKGGFRTLLNNIVNLAMDKGATDDVVVNPGVTVGKDRAKKIEFELDNLQSNTEFFFRNRPELSPEFVREDGNTQRAMDKRMGLYDEAFDQSDEATQRQFTPRQVYATDTMRGLRTFQQTYIRNPAETAVDPLWVYLGNPQLAKEVMPETTKLIREFLNDSEMTKGILTFYSSPLATAVAAALALLAVNGSGGEEEEMPMPMSGTPATGMLTI